MTRDQAIRRAIVDGIAQGRQLIVVAEHFRKHKPSYHLRDEQSWRRMRRMRTEGKGYQNWSEIWPAEEPVQFQETP